MQESINRAIEALPDFLRDVARMRLVEHRSYRAIQQETGRPLPTLRTYVNRAMAQLRRNPRLQVLFEEMRG